MSSNKSRLYNSLKKGVYIIHENSEWIPPFKEAFARAGISGVESNGAESGKVANSAESGEVTFGEIDLTKGSIDLDSAPPEGVFWSRLSASSHTRDHAFSKEYGRALLSWLESYGRCVINGSSVLELEVSKVRQYLALSRAGFRTPKTIAAFGKDEIINAAKEIESRFGAPFITKHNQGGKGLGVKRFESVSELKEYVESSAFEEPIDGITLLQEYIPSKEPFITRAEFIDAKFHYAVRVDTSGGAFELCPADACDIERAHKVDSSDLDSSARLPELAGAACEVGSGDKFRVREEITSDTPLIRQLETFLKAQKIQIAGIEFIESKSGEIVVYDTNTNTNYNGALESSLRQKGAQCAADRVVEFLREQYAKIR